MTWYFLLLRSFQPFYPLTDFLIFFTSVSNNIITSCSAVQLWPWTDFYSFCHFWLVFIYLKRVEKVNFGKKDFYNSGHFYPYYTKILLHTPLTGEKNIFSKLKKMKIIWLHLEFYRMCHKPWRYLAIFIKNFWYLS